MYVAMLIYQYYTELNFSHCDSRSSHISAVTAHSIDPRFIVLLPTLLPITMGILSFPVPILATIITALPLLYLFIL